MLTEKVIAEAADCLMGSCHTVKHALFCTLEGQYTESEFDQFLAYLTNNEIAECEVCGWWSYTGLEYVCDCGEDDE